MSTIANYIRDAVMTRLQNVTQWKSTRKSPIPTLQPSSCPALGVFVLRETYNPDGDANVAEPKYITDLLLSVSVVDLATKPDVLDGSVDALIATILDTLLTDPTFVSLQDTSGNYLIDSVPQIVRSYQFPQNGETYYMECRLQMTIRYYVTFNPPTPNALMLVDVTPSPQPSSGTRIMEIDVPQS